MSLAAARWIIPYADSSSIDLDPSCQCKHLVDIHDVGVGLSAREYFASTIEAKNRTFQDCSLSGSHHQCSNS